MADASGAPDGRARSSRRTSVLVTGEDTGGRLALVEAIYERGREPPRHLHHWEDETLYVLSGAVRIWIAQRRVDVASGNAVFLPRGVEHAVAVVSETARVLAALTPAGFEQFYEVWGAGKQPPPIEELILLSARYGCEITGPTPSPDRAE